MSSENALEFLLEHYKNKRRFDLVRDNQWEMLKKYKNPNGQTCRDFFNEINNEKAIVITDKNTEELSVLEGKNFLYFMQKEDVKPLYVYAPFISNTGLNFHFALYKNLKEQQIITLGNQKFIEALLDKLKLLFIEKSSNLKDKDIILRKDNMIVITNYDANLIIDRLEQNNFKFDSEIFKYYKNPLYQPICPDAVDIQYHFPQDDEKSSYQAMETIFNVLSKNELTDENYTRVRKLVRKMDLNDLNLSKKTALDINLKESEKINFLYELEIKRRKVKDYLG